jgi:hypothetical protein
MIVGHVGGSPLTEVQGMEAQYFKTVMSSLHALLYW